MPKTIHFSPEDFKYNEILNQYMERTSDIESPQPTDKKSYSRADGVTNWVPRYFPDKNGGDLISSTLKDQMVSIVFRFNAEVLSNIANQYAVGFHPNAKVTDLRPNHCYFVQQGYPTYYNYWAMTDPSQDEPDIESG